MVHRAVDVDREARQGLAPEGARQQVEQQLGPPDREHGHEHLGLGRDGPADDLARLDRRLLQRPVVAPAVRRLHDHDVRVPEGRRVAEERSPAGPQVAREDHRPRPAVLLHGQLDAGRAQDVPGVDEARGDAGCDVDGRVVGDRPEQPPQTLDVLLAVQRLERGLARLLPASVLAQEVALLQADGVPHDHPPQVERRLGAEDRPGVAALGEEREPADVVEVGVAHEDGIHVPARQHRHLPVLGRRLAAALVETAVHEYAGLPGGELERGPGHVARRAMEADLHRRHFLSRPDGRRSLARDHTTKVPWPRPRPPAIISAHALGAESTHNQGVDMRGAGFLVAVIATIVMLSSAVCAEEAKPDATLAVKQTSLALVLGYTWGNGTLTYADKTYPVSVAGFSVLAIGLAFAEATGEVYNLKKLEDFNGTYIAGSVEGTLGAGAGATTMRNQNGVVIKFFTSTEGLNLKISPEGIQLNLK
jgi:hypothetical protein